MNSLITAAACALAAGDRLGALKRVALRDDALAVALRGIAMAARRSCSREGSPAQGCAGIACCKALAFDPNKAVRRWLERKAARRVTNESFQRRGRFNKAGSIASSLALIWLSPGILRMLNSVWQFERPWPVSG
jgi:hypothetical protein